MKYKDFFSILLTLFYNSFCYASNVEILDNDNIDKRTSIKIYDFKKIDKRIFYNTDISKEKLIALKPAFDDTQRADADFLYYKAIFHSKLAKAELAIDNDKEDNIVLAVKIFKQLLKDPNTSTEIKKLTSFNLEELFQRYVNRGIKYYKINSLGRADKNFKIAQNIFSKRHEIFLHISAANYKTQNYSLALKNIEKYFSLGGKHSMSYYLASLIYEQDDNNEKALFVINQGLNANFFNDSLLSRKFHLYKKLNILNNKDFVIKNIPLGGKLYQKYFFYKMMGDLKKALKYLKDAYKKQSKIFEINRSMGIVYFNKAARICKKHFDISKIRLKKGKKKIEKEEVLKTKFLKLSKSYLDRAKKLKNDNLTNFTLSNIEKILNANKVAKDKLESNKQKK